MKQSSTSKPARRRSPKASTSPAKTPALHPPDNPMLREEIARLAHSYWEARGGDGGSPEDDWLRAEQELAARRTAGARK